MAMMTAPLADGMHSGIRQIRLHDPGQLLADGRIIPFLSQLTTASAGGDAAWELLFTSAAAPSGTLLEGRLILHTRVRAHQRPTLPALTDGKLQRLLTTLKDNGMDASEHPGPLPVFRREAVITLCKEGPALLGEEATLSPGHLRQHLCRNPGNGFSLLLVQSGWEAGEMETCGCMSQAQRAMLARDPVFSFVLTLWGPDAQDNAAWFSGLTLGRLKPFTPANPVLFTACLRHDPWHLMTLLPPLPPRAARLTLSEMLTLCGCPSEPGEMQQMCRMTWRQRAQDALTQAQLPLLAMDMTLQPDALRYMGLSSDRDLANVLQMDAASCDMVRMCAAILSKLGTLRRPEDPPAGPVTGRDASLTGLLLPTVGHIYEQLVRDCCYETMYVPYYAYATGLNAPAVTRIFLSNYDQGPGAQNYRLQHLPQDAARPALQNIIRDQMIDDYAAYAMIDGQQFPDVYWYNLFNDMTTARSQRNGLTHEKADLHSAECFSRAFLLDRPDSPSLLRRLLMCKQIRTSFPG